ncbi:MAG: hypothetical protein Q4G66_12290 [bacterium]|nr:hypothetical protein [bacterium]
MDRLTRYTLFAVVLLVVSLVVVDADAAQTIGRDTAFKFNAVQVLKTDDPATQPYVDVFNYFFTIQMFFGVFACFLRLVIRVFRM